MNKKKLEVMTPKFASDFACIGSDCTAHCCNTWTVEVDKQTYKTLKKHGDIVIRQLASSTFKLTRKSEKDYASIKMSNNGDCPVLDEKNLCNIHKKCGPKLLPHVCQDYPRTPRWFGEQAEMSMAISCPEVVKNVLYDPEAMMISTVTQYQNELSHGNIRGLTAANLPTYLAFIRDFCFSIALNSELNFEQQLFIIGLFLKQSDSHLNNITRLSELAENFNIMISDGTLLEHFQALPSVSAIKWHFFATQDSFFVTHIYKNKEIPTCNIKKFDDFIECQQMLMRSLNTNEASSNNDNIFIVANPNREHHAYTEILKISQKIIDEHLAEYPHLLNNFLLYSIYNDQFMAHLGKRPTEYFKFLILDILMLKSYLAGIAIQQEKLTKDSVVKLFQSYFRRRQHYPGLLAFMDEKIKEAELQSEYVIFSLLKN
ncbi:flagellin lysine-N-methylase [Shewanella baltica]|uniref:flagellin lysine-N-methylase n=1 Tax=Shewanella baltica TaxID=62322 RepID=UPI0039AE9F24